MENNRYHYLVKTERVSQTACECLESFTYIEGVFITNNKLKRVQLSLFHKFLSLTDLASKINHQVQFSGKC